MPAKITILTALTAGLVFGLFGLFPNGAAGDAGTHIQHFSNIVGDPYEIDVMYCFGGTAPVPDGGDIGRTADCGAGSSSTAVPKDVALTTWTVISIPIGARLGVPTTYTPSDGATEWQSVNPACGAPDANNECTAGATPYDLSSRTDLFCSNGPDDVLGNPGGTVGIPEGQWPDMTGTKWPPLPFVRTSASAGSGGFGVPTGGPNAYVLSAIPWPLTGLNAFAFGSIDTSIMTLVYLAGAAPYVPPDPIRLQLTSAISQYSAQSSSLTEGLDVSTVLIDESPGRPPDDSLLCLDSPLDMVWSAYSLKTPNADRVIPRWTVITSAPDLIDGTQQSLLDWTCVSVGTAEADDDGDCDPNTSDTNDASQDIDGDLVPDGVEVALGSSPTVADTDGDLSSDFREMVLFTDPTVPDSDGDGQLDKLDNNPTNGPAGDSTEVFDASEMTDDNCPAVANGTADGDPGRPGIQPSQLNTDSLRQYHGMGPLTGDRSNPDEDIPGDACDTDDDNDGLPDATEQVFTIVPWSGSADPGGADLPDTTTCAGPSVGVPPLPQSSTVGEGGLLGPLTGKTWPLDGPWNGDMDFDMVLDGRECEFRSRPDLAIRATASCVNTPVPDPDGCAQVNNGAGGGPGPDPDGDLLFLPYSNEAVHGAVETTYRTMGINTYRCPGIDCQDNNVDNDACSRPGDEDKDSDGDIVGFSTGTPGCIGPFAGTGLQDGIEVLFYGTGPGQSDTDHDGCLDGEEIIDIDGTFTISNASDGFKHILALPTSLDPDPDGGGPLTPDGDIDFYDNSGSPFFRGGVNYDINKNKALDIGDRLLIVIAQSSPGSCALNEASITIGNLVKNP